MTTTIDCNDILDIKICAKMNITYPDGSTYVGDWQNNKMHGSGILISKDFKYEGEFKYGKATGIGKAIYKNGSNYEGLFQNGKINGKGKLIYFNGDVYEGEFKDGLKHGNGCFINEKDGYKYIGDYKENVKDGIGKIIYYDGYRYEGKFKNNQPVYSRLVESLNKFGIY